MKKLLFLLLILLSTHTFSQKISEQGNIGVSAGVGLGLYSAEVEMSTPDTMETNRDQAGAYVYPISLDYTVMDRFNVGLLFQPANYIQGDSAQSNEDVKGKSLGLDLSYHFVNGRHFGAYLSTGGGYSDLDLRIVDDNGDLGTADFRGGYFEIGAGLKVFFTPHVGLFLDIDYDLYKFGIQELTVDGESKDLEDLDFDLTLKGMEASTGIAVNF